MSSKYSKEAQQELMERSLTNVRGLLDKIEKEEAAQRRSQRWIVVSLVAVTLILIGAIAFVVNKKGPEPNPIVVAPQKPAQ